MSSSCSLLRNCWAIDCSEAANAARNRTTPLVTNSTPRLSLRTWFQSPLRTRILSRNAPVEEPPLRSELFSTDQMERYGRTLAAAHRLSPRRGAGPTLQRLTANESGVIRACARTPERESG